MKRIRINKHSSVILLGLLTITPIIAQQKLDEKFTVVKDVAIDLNTSHTNVVFESWNKDIVAVEAFVEGEDLTKEQLEQIYSNWQVTATGNSKDIQITSNTARTVRTPNAITVNVQGNLQELQKLGPMITGMLEPLLQNIAQNPIPKEIQKNIGALHFDYAAYQKDGDAYMKKWEAKLKDKFGDDFEVAMQAWGTRMEKDAARMGQNIEAQMQSWAHQFEHDMQQWGQQFEQQMNTWASQNVVAANAGNNSRKKAPYIYEIKDPNPKASRTKSRARKMLKVRIPKHAQLRLNIRHGEVTLAEYANNLRASLSHTKLAANTIDGDATKIKASYSPVAVKNWNKGILIVDYVKNCRIENAKDIRLKTNSSNVYIQNLNTNGLISGNFGSITIANMSSDFSTLNLNLQNSDLKLLLPKAGFNFTYLGSRNLIQLPKTLEVQRMRNFGTESITGFHRTRNTDKSITINAEYSDLKIQ